MLTLCLTYLMVVGGLARIEAYDIIMNQGN